MLDLNVTKIDSTMAFVSIGPLDIPKHFALISPITIRLKQTRLKRMLFNKTRLYLYFVLSCLIK